MVELRGVATRWIYYNGRNSASVGTGQQIMVHSTDAIYMYDAYGSNTSAYISTSSIDVSQNTVFSFYHNGTSLKKRQYGAQYDSDVTAGTYNPAASFVNAIGYTPFDGKIYSIIVANYTSTLDIQRLEGYICHRYGAEALLASDHPYRYTAP